jgi:type IV pilus assembly protein PilW
MQRQTPHKDQLGMSIVELMVAVAISLIGVLVIFQVFAVNEGVRRSTTGGSDEQTSGLLGLMLLERELRHAGFGINDPSLVGCNMRVYDNMRAPVMQPDFPLTPVEITSNAGIVPDVIKVVYGGVTQTTAAVPFSVTADDPTEPIQLTFRFGFNNGDVMVVGQESLNCTLREVTGPYPLLLGVVELEHGVGAFTNAYTKNSQTPRFNNPAGTPDLYAKDVGKVMNLGPFPVRNEITVINNDPDPSRNNQLVGQNVWAQMAGFQPLADQIVHLKAEYGMDDGISNGTVLRPVYNAGDNVVDKFTPVSPATPADWRNVLSVRLAIVSRTNIIEKPVVGPGCDATPDWGTPEYPVLWARGPDAPQGRPIDVRVTPNWRCFKYRVYETTVPLRNMLWRQG